MLYHRQLVRQKNNQRQRFLENLLDCSINSSSKDDTRPYHHSSNNSDVVCIVRWRKSRRSTMDLLRRSGQPDRTVLAFTTNRKRPESQCE